jgi:hypothetical protein
VRENDSIKTDAVDPSTLSKCNTCSAIKYYLRKKTHSKTFIEGTSLLAHQKKRKLYQHPNYSRFMH